MTDRADEQEVESFASMFAAGFASQPARIEKRLKAEKRSAMTDRQRKRGGSRTTSISFRCSPEFRALVAAMAKQTDASIADVLDDALAMLAKAKRFKGSE